MHAIPSLFSLLSTLILLAQSTTTCAHPLDQLSSTRHQLPQRTALSPRACPNALANPSFEAPTLSPWTAYYTGSWASHGPATGAAHAGSRFFAAQSNGTNASTMTLSQSITLPATGGVRCEAWVRAQGRASFEVFVGGVSCGRRALSGTGKWVKISGEVKAGAGAKQAVVVGVVEGKAAVGVDGVWVGGLC
ncbi:hypothetical protein P171DRAFT_29353 [Karstenula rhodostoma CBS 690.94]|uniref:Concanavalin A-like lectin/glucanase n=1 Tax=Karstenula rhodostoma CBS 690.94 TaxID=1392251 RepID=A0A9P4PHR0_9PLEO|nr:hypothetical protein P171DRAFT_29353 [Karstenula rhodostoma CBS 690.94]